MRELLMDEYRFVAGGTSECEELAEDIKLTTTLDGLLAGAAIVALVPGGGTILGSMVAAVSLVAGEVMGDTVEQACEDHNDVKEDVES